MNTFPLIREIFMQSQMCPDIMEIRWYKCYHQFSLMVNMQVCKQTQSIPQFDVYGSKQKKNPRLPINR